MEVTAVGTRLGFVHASCGPSQVRDSRSNRKAAIRAAETLVDAGTDMNVGLLEDVDADERRQSYQELGLNLISGPFASLSGAEALAAVRSYRQTAANHNQNLLGVLRQLFTTGAWSPAPITPG